MPARSVCLVTLSLSEAGPGRFGRQPSLTDFCHTIPYHNIMQTDAKSECNIPLCGAAGWAPGAILWDMPTTAGCAIGKGAGIQAVQVQVHYTDANLAPGYGHTLYTRYMYTCTHMYTLSATPVAHFLHTRNPWSF